MLYISEEINVVFICIEPDTTTSPLISVVSVLLLIVGLLFETLILSLKLFVLSVPPGSVPVSVRQTKSKTSLEVIYKLPPTPVGESTPIAYFCDSCPLKSLIISSPSASLVIFNIFPI